MDATGIEVRPATEADAEGLAAYARALFAENLPTIFRHETAPSVEDEVRFIRGFGSANALLLVATAGGELCGMLGFRGHARPQLKHAGVIGFGVNRPFRRRGIGRWLFTELTRWTDGEGRISRIECDVFATNAPALGLLAEFGFEREGTMRRAIEVDGALIDNYLMARLRGPVAGDRP